MNSGGTTKSRVTVPSSIPPIVPTPTDMFPLAPTPLANISGSIPNTMVSEVMSMGRRRALAAAMAAALIDMPWRRRADAYSVSSMAVLESSPMSMMSPVCMYMLFSSPHSCAKMKLPTSPKGTLRMTANGIMRLS